MKNSEHYVGRFFGKYKVIQNHNDVENREKIRKTPDGDNFEKNICPFKNSSIIYLFKFVITFIDLFLSVYATVLHLRILLTTIRECLLNYSDSLAL